MMRRQGASLKRVGVAMMVASVVMTLLMVVNSFVAFGWEWGPRAPQFFRVQRGEIVRARAEPGAVHVPALTDRPRSYVGMGQWPMWEDHVRLSTWRFSVWPLAMVVGASGFAVWMLAGMIRRPR